MIEMNAVDMSKMAKSRSEDFNKDIIDVNKSIKIQNC